MNVENRLDKTEKKIFMTKCPNIISDRHLPFTYTQKMHRTFIKPSITSGLSALTLKGNHITKLMNFEKKLIRHMFSLRKKSPIYQLYLLLGLEPISDNLIRESLSSTTRGLIQRIP